MKKLGVFICHCGVNIAGTVDVKSVAEKIGKTEDVAHSTDYIYMCSEPGQQIIREAIREKGLDGVVVACCSPQHAREYLSEGGQVSRNESLSL